MVHLPGADGDEIRARLGVILGLEADGAAMVRGRIHKDYYKIDRGAADPFLDRIPEVSRCARTRG